MSDEPTYLLHVDSSVSAPVELLHAQGAILRTDERLSIKKDGVLHAKTIESDAFITRSDERCKNNIQNVEKCLEKILALQTKMYNYSNNDKTELGYIAQDVDNVLPEAVHVDSDGNMYISYLTFIPVITQAIQELYEIIKNKDII